MKRAFLPVVAVVAVSAVLSGQGKPDFSGKWKAAGSFTSWTITMDARQMSVTMTVAGNSETTVYLLDGTPVKKAFEGPNGPAENISTSVWEGEVLVTTTRTAFGTTFVEKRWLEPDGTMRVQNTLDIPGKPSPPPGPAMVFTKTGSPRQLPGR